MPMSSADVAAVLSDLWQRFTDERRHFDLIHDFKHGVAGVPDVPEKAPQHIKDLAPLAVDNIFPLITASFTDPLRIDGFSTVDDDSNVDAWALWQAEGMDARQSEVIGAAVDYGKSYLARHPVLGPQIKSPRMAYAVYENDEDVWPISAFMMSYDESKSATQITVRVHLYVDDIVQEFEVGIVPRSSSGWRFNGPINPQAIGDPIPSGFDHPPVVKFTNSRDADYDGIGEVSPLITAQRAISTVNYVSLVTAMQGGFPQKWVAGSELSKAELQQASAANIMQFSDHETKVGSFDPANLSMYDQRLVAMKRSAFASARTSPLYMSQMINLSAEAIALASDPYNAKLRAKQASFGESWERWLRLDAAAVGIKVPDDAEARWVEIEPRAFAAVVDGLTKVAATTTQVTPEVFSVLAEDIPGWTDQRIKRMTQALRKSQRARSLAETLAGLAEPDMTDAGPGGNAAS